MKKNRFINTDLNRVKLFMKVVEYQGFSTTASVLDVSPANISIQMRKLEDLLGVKLCHRGNKGFSLTWEGKKIYEAGQALMLAQENFDSIATTLERELVGELQIGVIDNAVFDPNLNVPELLHKLKKYSPKVEVTLHTLSPNELERSILDQRLHLAIGVFYERNSNLDYHSICHENLTLYCGKSHPLFNSKKIKLDEIESYAY